MSVIYRSRIKGKRQKTLEESTPQPVLASTASATSKACIRSMIVDAICSPYCQLEQAERQSTEGKDQL